MTTAVKKIKKYLIENDRSLSWLARQIGVSRQQMNHWVNHGRIPPSEYQRKLAKRCGVDVGDWG